MVFRRKRCTHRGQSKKKTEISEDIVENPITKIVYKDFDIDTKPPKKIRDLEQMIENKLTTKEGEDNADQ